MLTLLVLEDLLELESPATAKAEGDDRIPEMLPVCFSLVVWLVGEWVEAGLVAFWFFLTGRVEMVGGVEEVGMLVVLELWLLPWWLRELPPLSGGGEDGGGEEEEVAQQMA